jgi:hypothetical protein
MNIDAGKYRGRDLSDLPLDYLEWASVHLRLSPAMWDAVMAEQSRRMNAERVAAETPLEKALERPLHFFNKLVARLRLAGKGD